jgi:predicted metal-dependent hydrolase
MDRQESAKAGGPGQGAGLLPADPLTPVRWPAYTYVPGRTPHPESDPAGHRFGQRRSPALPLALHAWTENESYGRGLALFNRGYYWEAHEAWEGLWLAAGRRGPVADFLKGLIHLAASGVKAREGVAAGVSDHAERAAELFHAAGSQLGGGGAAGLTWEHLTQTCHSIARLAGVLADLGRRLPAVAPLVPVLPRLQPVVGRLLCRVPDCT